MERPMEYVIVKVVDPGRVDEIAHAIVDQLDDDVIEATPAYFDGFGHYVENPRDHPTIAR